MPRGTHHELNVRNVSSDDHDHSNIPQRLSRSPHPYHVRNRRHTSEEHASPGGCSARPLNDNSHPNGGINPKSFFDADSRKRRKASTSSSESGTEADNESGPLLRGLPAPPARLRKGLKTGSTLGTPSPVLTPSYLDDVKRRQALEAEFKRGTSLQSYAPTDEETLRVREKFRRKRRAELLRRTTETTLFFGVGFLACRNILLQPIQPELAVFSTAICGTYLLYPLRLYYHYRMQPEDVRQSRQFLRIPAAFDPATLLYPVLLPAFIAASLQPTSEAFLIVNLVLGIAAMPRTIVPAQDTFSGHTSVQYILSVLPTILLGKGNRPTYTPYLHLTADKEILSLLYPLHQALLPTLGYLTATSLLPAELQLLSISMINVLILSSSPQSLILKAILWIGGLSLFVLCRRVLEWGVALARIPSWRFSRNNDYNKLYLSLKRILKELTGGGQPGRSALAEDTPHSSDSDDRQRFVGRASRARPRGLTLATGNNDNKLLKTRAAMTVSPTESLFSQRPIGTEGTATPNLDERRRQRSSTLPSFTGPMAESLIAHSNTLRFPMPKTFRSLTKQQAAVIQWLYALYTYTVVILVIAMPIRFYVGRHALHSQEPVGWALGYLFCDIHIFRSTVEAIGLEHWALMPPSGVRNAMSYGWAEFVRWQYLGAANTRLLICLHCVCTISLGIAVVFRLSKVADVDSRRKVFHGMMVVMFLPTIFVDPAFVALALTLVLAIFLLLDLFRASQLPPLSRPLMYFLAPYVDGRDHRGPVIVSPLFLLIGCSIPLWLSLASAERSGIYPWQGWEVPTRDLSMISGVVCVGMGDAAASLVGRRYGRTRWCWSGGKSLEGSVAFAIAVVLGLSSSQLWLLHGGWHGASGDSWPVFFIKATVAATGASCTEAVLTGGNDNVIVPVILWLLVRGLAI